MSYQKNYKSCTIHIRKGAESSTLHAEGKKGFVRNNRTIRVNGAPSISYPFPMHTEFDLGGVVLLLSDWIIEKITFSSKTAKRKK